MPISPTPPSGRKTSSSASRAPAHHAPRRRRGAEMHVAGGDRPHARRRRARTTSRPVVVDGLEACRDDARRRARTATRSPSPAARVEPERGGSRRSPRPPSQSARALGPRVGQRRNSVVGVDRRRRAREATSPDRAGPPGASTHVDADADRPPRSAPPSSVLALEQDAGELGAVEQHIVRPFQLEAGRAPAAPPPSQRDADASDGATAQRLVEREPGDEAERGGDAPARAGSTRSRLAARLPGGVAQARPRRPRPRGLLGGDDPEPAADRPPARAASASRVGRADRRRSAASRYPSARAVGAEREIHRVRRRSWRRAPRRCRSGRR